MTLKIKNWKLALLALFGITFLTSLGVWQIQRGLEKKALIAAYRERGKHKPLTSNAARPNQDLRFYRIQVFGEFDQHHTFLLDNKTFKGQAGYEIYTPFKAQNLSSPILVDRGWVPMGTNRQHFPDVKPPLGLMALSGTLNLPPRYVAFGSMYERPIKWPLRIEFVNLLKMNSLLPYSLQTYIVQLDTPDAGIVLITPERHWGYAVQWFALAITLLILFAVLNWDRRST